MTCMHILERTWDTMGAKLVLARGVCSRGSTSTKPPDLLTGNRRKRTDEHDTFAVVGDGWHMIGYAWMESAPFSSRSFVNKV